MPFNADDYSKAPWASGIMTLTNDECVKVKDECETIKEGFVPDRFADYPTVDYVVSHYNELSNYKEAVNGDTYNVLESYNPEINTQGIDENGIIPEPQPEEPEVPEEEPTEEQPEEVEEAPVEEEVQPEEETTTEEENAPEVAPEAPEAE